MKAAKSKGIRSLYTGFGGDFLLSWSGSNVIYLLMDRGEYNSAFELLKKLSKNNGKSLLRQFKNDYLAYTLVWKQLSKLKPKKTNWQQQTALRDEFADKYKRLYKFDDRIFDQQLAVNKMMETGKIGRYAGKFVNRDAYYNVASENPLFDKDLLEFLIEVPVHLFIKDGVRRNLIRQATDGILPAEIRLRKDKLPYNPDFAQRIIDSRDALNEMMGSSQNSFVFDKYFSKQIILKHFDDIKPHAGFSGPTSTMTLRLVKAGIAFKALTHLSHLNYNF